MSPISLPTNTTGAAFDLGAAPGLILLGLLALIYWMPKWSRRMRYLIGASMLFVALILMAAHLTPNVPNPAPLESEVVR